MILVQKNMWMQKEENKGEVDLFTYKLIFYVYKLLFHITYSLYQSIFSICSNER